MANIKVYGLCKHVNKKLVASDQIVRLGYARLSLEEVPHVDWLWSLVVYPISYRGFIHPR